MPTNRPIDVDNAFTTSGSSPQVAVQYEATVSSASAILVRVCARRQSDGAAKNWLASFGAKRVGMSAPVANGTLLNVLTPYGSVADLLAMVGTDIALAISGNNIQLTVTGQSGQNIDWVVVFDGNEVY